MCIICNNRDLGDEYLGAMYHARKSLKQAEKILLAFSDQKNILFEPTPEKARAYNRAHKKLVKIRKSLGQVEQIREDVQYDYTCKVCGEPFDNYNDLYEHYDENHN